MIYDEWLDIKDWMRERGAVYEQYAKGLPATCDEIGISMNLDHFGWLDTTLYKNGKKVIEMPLSEIAYPLISIVNWLERIIDLPGTNDRFEESLHLDCEGNHVMMHYELVHAPEFGAVEDYQGLVIVYGTWVEDPKWEESTMSAIVSLPDFVASIYNGILNLFAPLPGRKYTEEEIIESWPAEDGDADDVMQLYNEVKSPKLEWFLAPKEYGQWFDVDFVKKQIRDTVLMEARPDGLFWNLNNECIGNHDALHIGDTICSLSKVQDLGQWSSRLFNPDTAKYDRWLDQGYLLAMKIREVMPVDVDLFFVNNHLKYNTGRVLYRIVPDMRQVVKGKHNGMRYQLIK